MVENNFTQTFYKYRSNVSNSKPVLRYPSVVLALENNHAHVQ